MLTGKQRVFLRGLGHGLRPVVQIGRGGIDDGLVAAVERALLDHELVKLKLGEAAEIDRHEAADTLAKKTKSEVAQVLGRMVLLYRAHPEEPKLAIPDAKGKMPAPKPVKAISPAPKRPAPKLKRSRSAD